MGFKSDTTRLKNILRNYRDHFITNIAEKRDISVVQAIESVDNSISLILSGL